MSRINYSLTAFLIVLLLSQSFSASILRLRRNLEDNKLELNIEDTSSSTRETSAVPIDSITNGGETSETPKIEKRSEPSRTTKARAARDKKSHELVPLYDEDGTNDSNFDDMQFASSNSGGGGSNLLSLLNLAGSLLPGLSGGNTLQNAIRLMMRDFIIKGPQTFLRRLDIIDNVIETDHDRKPTLDQGLNSDVKKREDNSLSDESVENGNNGAEESMEKKENENASKENQSEDSSGDSGSSQESSDDSDEPPGGGDGQGGGVLGFLAGLSGGDDGESDLGSVLAAISSLLVNLSGDGVDVNSIIASGLGLLVGLLSEGDQNIGSVLAGYLIASLEPLTGGGANNNGAFIGNFISTLVKGSSAAGDGSESGSDENTGMDAGSDSFGFFASLLMGLLGSMSSGSSSS